MSSKKVPAIALIISIIASVFISFSAGYGIGKIEENPIYRLFTLGISKPVYIWASEYARPITYDMLDDVPDDFTSSKDGVWFNYINKYTRSKLKKYMKQQNIYIVPKDYELDSAADIYYCLQVLEFRNRGR